MVPPEGYSHGGGLTAPLFREGRRTEDAQQSREKKTMKTNTKIQNGLGSINRAHRLNSPWPVNVWSVICDGSIDRKLEAGIHEKKDATELVLDGHLFGETPKEVNLHELLCIAKNEFYMVKTIE